MSLAEAIQWAHHLDKHELAWHMLVLADDPGFHSENQRKALVHVVLKQLHATL